MRGRRPPVRLECPYRTTPRPDRPRRREAGHTISVSRISTLLAGHDSWKTIRRFRPSHAGHGPWAWRRPVPLVYRRQTPFRLTRDFVPRHIRRSFLQGATGGGQTGRHQSDTIDGEVEHRRRGQDSAARDGDRGGCCARRLRLGLRSLGPVGPAVGASRLRAPLSPTASSSGLRSHRFPVAHCSRARGPCR